MENDTLIDELNYTFNFNMYLTRSILPNLHNAGDRERVVRWLKKLTTFNTSPDELRIRNDFMYYLVICVQKGALEPPFNAIPPTTGGIEEYAKLLDSPADERNTGAHGLELRGRQPTIERVLQEIHEDTYDRVRFAVWHDSSHYLDAYKDENRYHEDIYGVISHTSGPPQEESDKKKDRVFIGSVQAEVFRLNQLIT